MPEPDVLLKAIYDPSDEDLMFSDVTINLSTLLIDRVDTACRKTNLDPVTFYRVAILRALIDYEQYSNSI